jgi:signal transduction histidine kinase
VSIPDERGRLAVLVHEVRSPVAALRAIGEAARGSRSDATSIAELVRLALSACDAIERVVSDAPMTAVERERVDLAHLLADTASAVTLRGARVRVVARSGLPDAELDPVRVRQALENLVANALAHTPDGGEVVLEAGVEGADAILSVTDSGPGISRDEQVRVFEPGVRLGSEYAGSGLGLSVVKEIAEAHGGHVRVRSAPGEGATFTLVLPLEHV